ncbi:MAG: DUF4465 domain-containing protein [Bacteroidota bacterium]
MKLIYTLILLPTFFVASAQDIVVDFESVNLELDTFLNGSDGTTEFCLPFNEFDICSFEFPVRFDTSFGGFWAGGWAISTVLDTTDGTFMNLYGAAAGRGFEQSNTYAVGQQNSFIIPNPNGDLISTPIFRSLYVTNTTYAARVIRDGNSFSDPFGGDDGNDPDFFRLIVKGFDEGQPTGDSSIIVLADYRFDDNDQDFIIEDWTFVDLQDWSSDIDSLAFTLESSDVGPNGINTPLFFAVDELAFDVLSSVEDITPEWAPTAFPNPSPNGIIELNWPDHFAWSEGDYWYVHDALGRPITRGNTWIDNIDLSSQPSGVYYLILTKDQKRHSIKLIR